MTLERFCERFGISLKGKYIEDVSKRYLEFSVVSMSDLTEEERELKLLLNDDTPITNYEGDFDLFDLYNIIHEQEIGKEKVVVIDNVLFGLDEFLSMIVEHFNLGGEVR